jgi:hypothetical protein
LPPSHTLRTRPRTATAAVLVALALGVAGCGGSDSSSPAAAPTTPATVAGSPTAVGSKVTMGDVAGIVQHHNQKVFHQYRQRLLTKVGNAANGWLDGAFVGVSYPRQSFPSAFTSFTSGARQSAQKQKRLMTNWEWRKKIDGVVVKHQDVSVDVLAPHGHPAGATARVHLTFKTTGHVEKTVTVTGRLFLTRNDHGDWQVFGFDVAKGAK